MSYNNVFIYVIFYFDEFYWLPAIGLNNKTNSQANQSNKNKLFSADKKQSIQL